jgi:hypothetical protein
VSLTQQTTLNKSHDRGAKGVTDMSNKAAIFAGGLGGVAPNLVRLFVNYSSPSPQHIINQPVSYSLAMLGFAVLGGLVVWVFQETNLKQALFLGIGLPSLFQIGSLQSAPSLTPPTIAPGDPGLDFTGFFCLRSTTTTNNKPFCFGCRPDAQPYCR